MKAMAKYSAVQRADEVNYNELVAQHAPLVKRIAYHLMGRLPSNIQLDDLVQAGMIGLFEALKGYDSSQGASFETYARIRVQGAMIDEVRRGDWTPRSVYRKARLLAETVREIEEREGRDARDREVAEALDMDMDQYNALVKDAAGCHVLSYEDMYVTDSDSYEEIKGSISDPYKELQKGAFKESLAEAIAGLPERERLVMALYYDEEFNLREIGEVLGVSEGRVCQIHGQALIRVRARMKDWTKSDE